MNQCKIYLDVFNTNVLSVNTGWIIVRYSRDALNSELHSHLLHRASLRNAIRTTIAATCGTATLPASEAMVDTTEDHCEVVDTIEKSLPDLDRSSRVRQKEGSKMRRMRLETEPAREREANRSLVAW